jgi:two-component system, LytTR family, response regulator
MNPMASLAKIKTLIIDDEALAREGLRLMAAGDAELEIVGECATGQEALAALREHAPDLLLLDVQMPEMNGFELLQRAAVQPLPVVIFVTAYDRYAIRAFEAQALDYLLKPVSDERFSQSLARAKAQIAQGRAQEENRRLTALLANLQQDQKPAAPPERMVVKSGGQVFFIQLADIDWIEAADYYVMLHVNDKAILLRETLAELTARLNPQQFVRIHRSAVVNLNKIKEVRAARRGDYTVILHNDTQLKLSRRRRAQLQELIARLA